jgi:hypothetical protein
VSGKDKCGKGKDSEEIWVGQGECSTMLDYQLIKLETLTGV